MIDAHVVEYIGWPAVGHEHECAGTVVAAGVNIVDGDVVNAKSGSRQSWLSCRQIETCDHRYTRTRMADCAVADGDIGDLANGADAGAIMVLVFWRQHNRISRL